MFIYEEKWYRPVLHQVVELHKDNYSQCYDLKEPILVPRSELKQNCDTSVELNIYDTPLQSKLICSAECAFCITTKAAMAQWELKHKHSNALKWEL